MRNGRVLAAVLVTVLLLVSGSEAWSAVSDRAIAVSLSQVDGQPILPSGWRWDSYGGVEVGVPADWGWADRGLRLGAWCVRSPVKKRPVVARPLGPVLAIECNGRETLVANTGWVVGFGHSLTEPDGVERTDDRTTVRIDGVEIILQAPPAWRERIAATIHRVRVDDFGCPTTHPISTRPSLRPPHPVDVAALRDVTTVSACQYELRDPSDVWRPRTWLKSSLRLDGAAAERAIARIAQASPSGGPDQPGYCAQETAYGQGSTAIVLRVRSASGLTEIILRYAGCVGHGFDDGVHVWRLSAAAMAPFIAGPNDVLEAPDPLDAIPLPHPNPSRSN